MSALETPPQPVDSLLAPVAPPTIVRHRFTLADYERMIETGILKEEDRVELIHGEVLEKMVIGDEHAAATRRLNRLLQRILGDRAMISVQDPVALGEHRPEPDLALLRMREDFYAGSTPQADAIHLIIEIADTSLAFDRTVKAALYAAHGLPEYWIVNLIDRVLEVRRNPQTDGAYAEVRSWKAGESLNLLAFPDVSIAVSDLLP